MGGVLSKWVFLLFAGVAVVAAIFAAWAHRSHKKKAALGAGLWLLLSSGLAMQGLAPNLQIDSDAGSRAFVIPPSQMSGVGAAGALIDRERKMTAGSAVLMVLAGVGLAIFYRRAFTAPSSSEV